MFSKACEYGLKAALHISLHSNLEKKMSITEIANELNFPRHFLSKILQTLVKSKILKSSKGPNGGFYLTEQEKKIPIIRIVEVLDGLDTLNKCGIGIKKCSDDNPCPIHHEFKPYRDKLRQLFSERTIADMTNFNTRGDEFKLNSYTKM